MVGYSVRKKYDMITTTPPTETCSGDSSQYTFTQTYCAANHTHNWYCAFVGGTRCVARGHDMRTQIYHLPCWGHPKGSVVVVPYTLDNLDITEYKNLSYWSYLDTVETKQYDMNGENPVTSSTHYYYDNPNHIQLTRTETTGSDGKTVVSKTYYPDDNLDSLGFGSAESSLIKKLGLGTNGTGLHRIAEPVQAEQWVDNQKTSTRRTLYKGWIQNGDTLILPEVIEASTGGNPLEPRASYSRYDEKGNPLEVSKDRDVKITYYWGYNKQYPVAKFENMSYSVIDGNSDLKTNLDSLERYSTLSIANKRVQLKSLNNSIRTKVPTGVMVSTYTFDPMVGMTSSTDPNGVTTYYEYDITGRLKFVKDSNGNVLKSYEYNYAQP